MNFATTWWVSPGFPPGCVASLRRQVEQQGKVLDVYTNSAWHGGYKLDNPYRYPGWWSKLELFRPDLAHQRPMLFMDLDTFVLGDLTAFEALDTSKLWMVNDWNRPQRATSSLLIVPDDEDLCSRIWMGSKLRDRSPGAPDGDFLEGFPHERLQGHVDGLLSYKADKLGMFHVKPDARIVCFHGKPKPWELREGWASDWYQHHV